MELKKDNAQTRQAVKRLIARLLGGVFLGCTEDFIDEMAGYLATSYQIDEKVFDKECNEFKIFDGWFKMHVAKPEQRDVYRKLIAQSLKLFCEKIEQDA